MALSEIPLLEKPAALDIWGFQVAVDVKGHRQWPDEIKRLAVQRMATSKEKTADIASELSVDPSVLYQWRRQQKQRTGKSKKTEGPFVEILVEEKKSKPPVATAAEPVIVRYGDVEVTIPGNHTPDWLAAFVGAIGAQP